MGLDDLNFHITSYYRPHHLFSKMYSNMLPWLLESPQFYLLCILYARSVDIACSKVLQPAAVIMIINNNIFTINWLLLDIDLLWLLNGLIILLFLFFDIHNS